MLEWKPRLMLLVLVAVAVAMLLGWGHLFHHPANYGW